MATHKELAAYLRCVIYDLFVLAKATEKMVKESDHALTEVYKTAALVKLRTVYDFFHRPEAQDSIKLKMFDRYSPKKPDQVGLNWDKWLTLQSINTYVVHLDTERVTKTMRIPQPKFDVGKRAILKTAVAFMTGAHEFVANILSKPDFVGLNDFGKCWLKEFNETLARLTAFKDSETHWVR